jgi:hypothetical protein
VIDLPSGAVVQRSDRFDPILDHFSCPVEIVGPVEDGSLDTTAAVMTHDDNMADIEVRHTICKGGGGAEVSTRVLIRDVTFGEKDTWERSEDGSFGRSRVTAGMIGRISEGGTHTECNRVLPASKENKVGMLAIDGQVQKEIRIIRFCNALAESGISLHEGEKLRVLVGGVRQGTDAALVLLIAPGGKCGGSEDGGVKCRKDSVEQKRPAEHAGRRGMGWGRTKGRRRRGRGLKDV